MSYQLRASESVLAGLQRVCREQIDKALAEIKDETLDRHRVVHQVRKRCKRIRGALRLIRSQLPHIYQKENIRYRKAARELAGIRTAAVLVTCYGKLMKIFRKEVDRRAVASVHRELIRRQEHVAETQRDIDAKLKPFAKTITEGRRSVASWRLHGKGFPAIEAGLRKTYRLGRRAMAAAKARPTAENFHEWRKQVKYHRYHTRLLLKACPPVGRGFWKALKQLSDFLGEDHDLAVLRETLLADSARFPKTPALQRLVGLIDQRRTELETAACRLGQCVYAEKPKHLARRLRRYWHAWRPSTQ